MRKRTFHQGYCLKSPHGDLWPAYFNENKEKVRESAEENIPEANCSWVKARRLGYSVVPVNIKEVREIL